MQVQRVGSPNAVIATSMILLDTRAKLYGLLAADVGGTVDQAGEAPSSPDAGDQ